ncbi:SAM-dependent methyltransferase [Phytoactinopolyspora halotolerans]|uniref:SAM-dependent methyltransferase n=1 Tax=Phytoactinopolyspora halotolerans TaxID=1981512 RepID=A0A6L9SH86_9ACTN|nr:SAM-dependent methyltransferase [Phytoactinopolyspora halotolerans]NEE03792.1 SAM-dependent methyltransferase [Phytoactinopolyspora halotolerans]
MDWHRWHQGYQEGGKLQERLRIVQDQLRLALAAVPPGPVQIISVCAGQGHDVVGMVSGSERRGDVRACLVELDGRNVAEAQRRIDDADLQGFEVRQADAGITDTYDGAAPADIVLLCGEFGSLTDDDVESTVATLPQLCKERGQVIWTAHRAAPGLFEHASAAFERHGFVPVWKDPNDPFGVARDQLVARPREFRTGQRMFSFADEQTLIALGRTI